MTHRQELCMPLIVGRRVVHGEDMQDHGSARWDGVLPDAHILQGFAHHQRRHTVHALGLLHKMHACVSVCTVVIWKFMSTA